MKLNVYNCYNKKLQKKNFFVCMLTLAFEDQIYYKHAEEIQLMSVQREEKAFDTPVLKF